jgi:hypothetical protein
VGNVRMQLGLVREVLHRLEMAQDIRILSSWEVWLLNMLKQHCLSLASFERTVARLRSRIHYLEEGDANTKFFHLQSCYRKKKNFISKLEEDGRMATNHDDMQQILEGYFCNLLGADLQRHFTIDLSNCHKAAMDLSALEHPFSEEVRDTIACLSSDKVPGPDGFTGKFYKTCWDIIKVDIMAALNSLYLGNAYKLDLLNSAYLILLPKREDATSAGDFWPISLIHSFAKLVTKILANRLGPYLQDLVAANQSAFIRGRSIHDNFMLVQQSIKFLHKKRISSLLRKLDISKAFDSVSWAFLLEILSHLGFGPVWHNLISNLLFTSSTQVLLNGSPGNHIFHQRGLRQGDPLSPMLFVLVMDVLSSLFRAAENRGLLQSLGGADVRSRVSIYADDVVLFIKPIEADLNCAKMILNCFGSASGLVTNMLKSSAIPIRCDDQLVHAGYSVLQCSPTSFPCRYLGLPISDKKLRKCDLKLWIEKIADRLPNWKARLLNLAGWTALVKFVLSANPTYLLIAINVPQWVIKSIDKIQREFLWRGRKEVNGGSCLVPWEVVTRPLKFGGLGIPNFKFKSWALQAKWLWMEKTDLSRPWHGLSLLVQRQVRQFFDLSVFTILGNGATTLFWSDRWIHGNTIQDIAPEVVGMVGRRAYSSRTVAQALDN